MKKSVILSVVEPISYSLNSSIAWTLVSSLQAKKEITLLGPSNSRVGALIGTTPLLQPIRMVISGQPAFLLSMRAFLNVTPDFKDAQGGAYTLISPPNGTVLATMSSSTLISSYANPFIIISPQLSGLASSDVLELTKYINFLAATLWHTEPINWTTHRLHLAANGQFMTNREMALSGIQTGMPIFSGSPLQLASGPKPMRVAYRQWRGAGALSIAGLVPASGLSSCSSSSSSSGGTGSGDSPDGSGGAGGSSGGGAGGGGGSNSFSGDS